MSAWARGAPISTFGDLGVRVELDEVDSHACTGSASSITGIDGAIRRVEHGSRVDRYQLATPAYSLYGVLGLNAQFLAGVACRNRCRRGFSLRAERRARSRSRHRSHRRPPTASTRSRAWCCICRGGFNSLTIETPPQRGRVGVVASKLEFRRQTAGVGL